MKVISLAAFMVGAAALPALADQTKYYTEDQATAFLESKGFTVTNVHVDGSTIHALGTRDGQVWGGRFTGEKEVVRYLRGDNDPVRRDLTNMIDRYKDKR